MRKKYPRQDDLTHEWFWRGKWYDHYPYDEVEDYNERRDRYLEDKHDGLRDEGRLPGYKIILATNIV